MLDSVHIGGGGPSRIADTLRQVKRFRARLRKQRIRLNKESNSAVRFVVRSEPQTLGAEVVLTLNEGNDTQPRRSARQMGVLLKVVGSVV